MLSPKERFIFYSFIRCYLKEGRPIGSKYLAKKLNFKFSPSLLRIYFQKLVKKGLILNTYNFVGRLPSDKGLRYYLLKYKPKPEINLKADNLEENLEKFLFLAKNVCLVIENEEKVKIKGLASLIEGLRKDEETLKDATNLIENIFNFFDFLLGEIGVKIGKEIKISKSKNLSLGFVKKPNKTYIFLGPKKNYYHTLWSLLMKIKEKNE